MIIETGPTGNLIQGDVLDVNKKHLEEAMQAYDPLLYITWNPKKRFGWGMWEIRRLPEKKSLVYRGSLGESKVFELAYVEKGVENHVKDIPLLTYELVSWLQRNDLWKDINFEASHQERVTRWIDNLEKHEEKAKADNIAKKRAEAVYRMAQERSALRDFKTAINSGTNPADLARYWK